jgi:hypothetical protein
MQQTDWFMQLLDHRHFLPAAGMLLGAIAIIAVATVVVTVVRFSLSHRQRMAMIARGMHPDDAFSEPDDEAHAVPGEAPPHG